jgi:hypothetical protein
MRFTHLGMGKKSNQKIDGWNHHIEYKKEG